MGKCPYCVTQEIATPIMWLSAVVEMWMNTAYTKKRIRTKGKYEAYMLRYVPIAV
jgi:hypothetical protein